MPPHFERFRLIHILHICKLWLRQYHKSIVLASTFLRYDVISSLIWINEPTLQFKIYFSVAIVTFLTLLRMAHSVCKCLTSDCWLAEAKVGFVFMPSSSRFKYTTAEDWRNRVQSDFVRDLWKRRLFDEYWYFRIYFFYLGMRIIELCKWGIFCEVLLN